MDFTKSLPCGPHYPPKHDLGLRYFGLFNNNICQWLCKSGHSQTSFASHTFNTEYYFTLIYMHISAYVYQDSASWEKFKLCCRLHKKQNGHLPDSKCHVAVQKSGHLNTSALTTAILYKTFVISTFIGFSNICLFKMSCTLRECPLADDSGCV